MDSVNSKGEIVVNIIKDNKENELSKHEAMQLLFEGHDLNNHDESFMDNNGNYVFPTDLVVDTPNTAIGGSFILNTIGLFDLKKE